MVKASLLLRSDQRWLVYSVTVRRLLTEAGYRKSVRAAAVAVAAAVALVASAQCSAQ
jgi:hypothetical protein